ncbi:MAG: hypothetical protein QM756_09095 [Polyangiaceae bacterium]
MRGQNIYAEDVEQHVEANVEVLRRGRVAAFASELEGGEGVGVVAEIARAFEKFANPESVCRAVSEAVSAAYGDPALVVLVRAGSLPLTSSGKLQRAAARRAWETAALSPLHVHRPGAVMAQANEPAAMLEASETELRLGALWQEMPWRRAA